MSAYGPLGRKASAIQKPTQWPLDPTPAHEKITIYHLNIDNVPKDLLNLLYSDFQGEVQAGMTYPQEGDMSLEQFSAYYFAADVLVAISQVDRDGTADLAEEIEIARKDRSWEESYVGCYYVSVSAALVSLSPGAEPSSSCPSFLKVKPNYPGRSSHVSLMNIHHLT